MQTRTPPMKLDEDLIRTILLTMEADEKGRFGKDVFRIPDVPEAKLHYHFWLLQQAGFITAADTSGAGGLSLRPELITWNGQEFLMNIKNDTVWSKTKEAVSNSVGIVSLAMLGKVAESVVTTLIRNSGIPI